MTDVFELTPFYLARLHGLSRRGAFQGLDGGQFITAHHMASQLMQQWCIGIQRTNRLNLRGEGSRVSGLGFGVEPVAAAMRLQIGLAPKNASDLIIILLGS